MIAPATPDNVNNSLEEKDERGNRMKGEGGRREASLSQGFFHQACWLCERKAVLFAEICQAVHLYH